MADPRKFDDELVITFREPIMLADLAFDAVTLNEPTGKMLQLAAKEKDEYSALFVLITHAGRVPPAVPSAMRQRDLQRAMDFFAHFASDDSSTTSTSSPQS